MNCDHRRHLLVAGAMGGCGIAVMALLLLTTLEPDESLQDQAEQMDPGPGEIVARESATEEVTATGAVDAVAMAPAVTRGDEPRATAASASDASTATSDQHAETSARPVDTDDSVQIEPEEVVEALTLGAPIELAKTGFGTVDYTDLSTYHATQRALVASVDSSDPAAMQTLRARLVLADQRQQNQLRRVAHERGIPFVEVGDDGSVRRFMGLRDGEAIYLQSTNVNAAATTGVDHVRGSTALDPVHGVDIDGSGFRVQIHDSSLIFDHQEFLRSDGSSRIVPAFSDHLIGDHPTHVAGTILAAGQSHEIRGMAPAAEGVSIPTYSAGYMVDLAMGHPHHTDQTIVGNASVGSNGAGGGYTSDDALYDEAARSQAYFLLFLAAANNGPGWDTIAGNAAPKEAKNSVCIGSVSDGSRDSAGRLAGGADINDFSSRGPNDDGRIKPDLVANGDSIKSTSFDWYNDPPYTSIAKWKTGTSMASPNATGSAVLLQDYHSKLFGTPMPAQTLKALLIHSADDRGNTGPDYSHGWGLMNVHAAALILRGAADGSMPRAISEALLQDGSSFERQFTWDGSSPLRATCQWWDPALPEERYAENDANLREPHLVNDLDLRLIAPDDTVHLPYVMPYVTGGFKEEDIGDTATTGDNTTDNVEMVHIDDPAQTGEWTLRVTHKGELVGGEQSFSLILTGVGAAASDPLITGVTPASGTGRAMELVVSGADLQAGSTLHLRRGQTTIAGTECARTMNGELLARFDLRAAGAGAWDLEVRNPDGTGHTLSDAFTVRPILANYLDEDFEDDFALGTGGWTSAADVGSDDWQRSSARSASGEHSVFVPAADTATDSWVRSPAVTLDDTISGNLRLTFDQYSTTEANFDGVLCEIQVDGGSWQDITTYGSFLSGGYTGVLFGDRVEGQEWFDVPNVPNPLAGRAAWHGRSGGWLTTIVDLDEAALAGRTVALRWRHAADGEISKEGWYLDDVALGDEGSAPGGISIDAIAADPTLVTGSSTQLSVSASAAGGGPLSYSWTATTIPTGAAPQIGAGEDPLVIFDRAGAYVFQVTVSDNGGDSAVDSIAVIVQQTAAGLQLAP